MASRLGIPKIIREDPWLRRRLTLSCVLKTCSCLYCLVDMFVLVCPYDVPIADLNIKGVVV